MAQSARWDDLRVRVIWGAAMFVAGALAVVLGGVWFQMTVVFVTAVMVWELWMMIAPERPTPGMLLAALLASVMSGQLLDSSIIGLAMFLIVPLLGAISIKHERRWFFVFALGMLLAALLASVMSGQLLDSSIIGLAMFLIVPLLGAISIKHERRWFFVFALGIQVAGWGLVQFRGDYGFTWIIWLMLVVVATDIFGYLAGRTLGGPKFWPAISPKKTWSGTAAGWIASSVVGLCFMIWAGAGWQIVLVSIVLSFASQMGDIAESALKRRMGVKDSSTLIPGHGGLFDRFDALLGASLFMLLVAYVLKVPGVTF